MKALVVVGTRPEAIKLAPVLAALSGSAETVLVTTGQHGALAAAALAGFGLVADEQLPEIAAGRSLNTLVAELLAGLDGVLARHAPDWVVVQGDTSSAFAAALAGFHRGIAVAHVEAGLRTHSLLSPFPEEANRQMIARLARLHFAPTEGARGHLLAEGVPDAAIRVAGNTVVDAVELVRRRWTPARLAALDAELGLGAAPTVLVTFHRRENLADPAGICRAVAQLAARYREHLWVFPMHPNPALRAAVAESLAGLANLRLGEPLGHEATLRLLARAELVLTDSGGLQEEAASFGTPVIVMRDRSERPEGIAAGFAELGGRDAAGILAAAIGWLDHPDRRRALAGRPNPYGDGAAARRIADALLAAGATR